MDFDDPVPDRLRTQLMRSSVALSLASSGGDRPLVLVNRGFLRLTGLAEKDCLGQNCRLLQTPETPARQIGAMADFLADDSTDDGRFTVLNQRHNGTVFTNLVFMSKLRDTGGALRFILASQFDATAAETARSLARNDEMLTDTLTDLRRTAGQFGMTISDSAVLIARSITTLARLTVRDE